MPFNSTLEARKALRISQNKRVGNINSAIGSSEPFTSVFDINTRDVYAYENLIPSGSNIPFSGSSQNGHYVYSDGTFGPYDANKTPILQYYYRLELTEATHNDGQTYFTLSGVTPGEANQTDAQRIFANQLTNWISNKYVTGSKSGDHAETGGTGGAGYNVRVFTGLVGGSAETATFANAYDYEFDYKTGVLQFYSPLTNSTRVYLSGYRYVGATLDTRLKNIESSLGTGPSGGGGGTFISSSNQTTSVTTNNANVTIAVNNTTSSVAGETYVSFNTPVTASIFTGSLVGIAATASFVTSSDVWGPYGRDSIVSASFAYTASNITNAYVGQVAAAANQLVFSAGSGNVSGSTQFVVNTTANNSSGSIYIGGTTISGNGVNWVANGSVFNIGLDGGGTQAIVINPTGGAGGNGLITFNYSASFTAPTTFQNAVSTTFADQFILLASGSGAAKDAGIVFEDWSINGAIGTGSVLFADNASTKRLAYRFTGSVDQTDMTPQAFINMTFVKDPAGTAPWHFASKTDVDDLIGDKPGFMWLDSNGDIYIKA